MNVICGGRSVLVKLIARNHSQNDLLHNQDQFVEFKGTIDFPEIAGER